MPNALLPMDFGPSRDNSDGYRHVIVEKLNWP
jgi:hypothetical protein